MEKRRRKMTEEEMEREREIRDLGEKIRNLILKENMPPDITESALSFVYVVYLLHWKVSKKDFKERMDILVDHYNKEFDKAALETKKGEDQ